MGEKNEASARQELAYGLGASSHQLKDFDRAVRAFSEALESEDTEVQHRAHRGLGHALYDQGDKALARQPQFTLKTWTDAIRHFDAALKIEGDDKEVRENLEFVKSRVKELKVQLEEQKKQQEKKKGDKKGGKKDKGDQGDEGDEGEKGQKGKQGEEGEDGQEGKQGQKSDQPGQEGRDGREGEEGKNRNGGKGETDDEQEGKDGETKEAKEKEVLEGKLQAAGDDREGEDRDGQSARAIHDQGDIMRNTETGYSRNEAREFLRMFSDDQRQVQVRQSRREPAKGKDW